MEPAEFGPEGLLGILKNEPHGKQNVFLTRAGWEQQSPPSQVDC